MNPPPCSSPDRLAYVFDGSFEGLLTAAHHAARLKELPLDLLCGKDLQPRLDQRLIPITTDIDAARQVRRSLIRCFGEELFDRLSYAAASDEADAPTTVLRFVLSLLPHCTRCIACPSKRDCLEPCGHDEHPEILSALADPLIGRIHELARSVANERHHMIQFIRFERLEDDLWFARCNPKAKVVPFLMGWFCARFNTQRFIIFDEVHRLSGVYDGRHWRLVQGDLKPPPLAAGELACQEAWRRFFHAVDVNERHHPELQRQFMPKRLWKNITEMKTPAPTPLNDRREG